jgi:hypothetical protein
MSRNRLTPASLVKDILWVYHHLDKDNPSKAPSKGARVMHRWFNPPRRKDEEEDAYEARRQDAKELFFRQMLSRVIPREASIDAFEKVEEEAVGPHLEKLDKFMREFEAEAAAAPRLAPQENLPVRAGQAASATTREGLSAGQLGVPAR